jgi:hypothetical protein
MIRISIQVYLEIPTGRLCQTILITLPPNDLLNQSEKTFGQRSMNGSWKLGIRHFRGRIGILSKYREVAE